MTKLLGIRPNMDNIKGRIRSTASTKYEPALPRNNTLSVSVGWLPDERLALLGALEINKLPDVRLALAAGTSTARKHGYVVIGRPSAVRADTAVRHDAHHESRSRPGTIVVGTRRYKIKFLLRRSRAGYESERDQVLAEIASCGINGHTLAG